MHTDIKFKSIGIIDKHLIILKMSNNPKAANHPNQPTHELPSTWVQFISQTMPLQKIPRFPKPQILTFFQSPSSPKVKQLLLILPSVHHRYLQNCQHFCQLLTLLYVLTVKGCVGTSVEFVAISMEVLEQLLRYRLVVLAGLWRDNFMAEIWGWMGEWLGVFVPAVLMGMTITTHKDREKDKEKGSIMKKEGHSPKTFISILTQLNKTQSVNSAPYNPLLLLFESLLISKIRNHLTPGSLFQFDSLLRHVLTPLKYRLIYQGKGCVSHLTNKEKERADRERELLAADGVVISGLVPVRVEESGWRVCELRLVLPEGEGEEGKRQKGPIKLKKVPSQAPMQPWVMDSYSNPKPNPIKISLNTFLTKMKTLQMYRFLCLLQLYGSSPNIEVLNEYIPDETLLEIFTKFLLGEGMAELVGKVMGEVVSKDKGNKMGNNVNNNTGELKYSYRNQRLGRILESCMTQAGKIHRQENKNLFIQELRTRLFAGTKPKPPNNHINNHKPDTMKQNNNNNRKIDDYFHK